MSQEANDHREVYGIYSKFFNRRGRRQDTVADAEGDTARYRIDRPWLPADKNARVLDLGCGWGQELLGLWASGYRNLTGVDLSPEQIEGARAAMGDQALIIHQDIFEFLGANKEPFDLILCFDIVEHFHKDEALKLMRAVREHLAPGGVVAIRTPNMSSLLASFSRYIDLTHETGHTEYSLFHLLDLAGFDGHTIVHESLKFNWRAWRPWAPWRGFGVRKRMNYYIHRKLFSLRDQKPPECFEFNLEVYSFNPPVPQV